MAGIAFDSVCKRYGDVAVIANLSLDIKDGEFMVLVGPSGCGKSTALRMIAGLETISDGKLKIDGKVVNDLKPKDRDVAMVFQSYALYPHMTVRQNVAFGLEVRKMPKAEIEKRVSEASALLGLDPYLDRKPKALSGGQRQRVALGRAIVRDPSVFLFDEPLSNLDAKLRTGMRAEISRLQKRLGTTAVYVTHDQTEAMTMGHRIAVLAPLAEAGESNLMQVGTPLELYDTPRNVFVARFIGAPSMAILDASLDGRTISHSAMASSVGMPAKWQLHDSGNTSAVQIGFRPEDVKIAGTTNFANAAHFEGEVEMVETLGHEVLIHVKVGDKSLIAKSFGHANVPELGDPIKLEANLDKMHMFDATSSLRLIEQA
jgi:multiple sugar transport system ATP-binding protein